MTANTCVGCGARLQLTGTAWCSLTCRRHTRAHLRVQAAERARRRAAMRRHPSAPKGT